jgi:hypothetical protein
MVEMNCDPTSPTRTGFIALSFVVGSRCGKAPRGDVIPPARKKRPG